jgi:hypothetical protein
MYMISTGISERGYDLDCNVDKHPSLKKQRGPTHIEMYRRRKIASIPHTDPPNPSEQGFPNQVNLKFL